jgi:hypothetical protein
MKEQKICDIGRKHFSHNAHKEEPRRAHGESSALLSQEFKREQNSESGYASHLEARDGSGRLGSGGEPGQSGW